MEPDVGVTGTSPIQTFGVFVEKIFFGRTDWGKGPSRADLGMGRGDLFL